MAKEGAQFGKTANNSWFLGHTLAQNWFEDPKRITLGPQFIEGPRFGTATPNLGA